MTLDAGEIEKWSGQPKQGIVFSSHDIFLIPFSIMWCGFAIFWEALTFSMGAPGFFSLWGIPFVVVGLYFVIGRFIHDYINRKNTVYIVTDKRIIIRTFSKIESIQKGNWSTLKLQEFSDGTGNILFAEPQSFFMRSRNWGSMLSSNIGAPAFFKIPDVKRVYSYLTD